MYKHETHPRQANSGNYPPGADIRQEGSLNLCRRGVRTRRPALTGGPLALRFLAPELMRDKLIVAAFEALA
jgi:hypothetical protein